MTKNEEIIYIDKETYYQIIGQEDEQSYINFLKNNPKFVNFTNQRKSIFSENIVQKECAVEEVKEIPKKTKLQIQHEKADDYRYFPHRIWLEQYLPRFEMVYGKFFYSNENLSNKEKCQELLTYYSEVCHINNIEDIKNSSAHLLKSVYGYISKIPETIKKGPQR